MVDKREEPIIRLEEYRAIMDAGGELNEEQLLDMQEIADEIAEMLERFVAALKPIAEYFIKFIADFAEAINGNGRWNELLAKMAALDMEKVLPNGDLGTPITVDLVNESGDVLESVATDAISLSPTPATLHINAKDDFNYGNLLANNTSMGLPRRSASS